MSEHWTWGACVLRLYESEHPTWVRTYTAIWTNIKHGVRVCHVSVCSHLQNAAPRISCCSTWGACGRWWLYFWGNAPITWGICVVTVSVVSLF
jgi:hypothetical protein